MEEAIELEDVATSNEKGVQTGSIDSIQTSSSADDVKRCVCRAAKDGAGLEGASCLECAHKSSDDTTNSVQREDKMRATDDTQTEEMTPGLHLANHILCPICTEDFVEGELVSDTRDNSETSELQPGLNAFSCPSLSLPAARTPLLRSTSLSCYLHRRMATGPFKLSPLPYGLCPNQERKDGLST